MTRALLALLLVACSADAKPRVYSRDCDFSSRRSSRGGVACSTSDLGANCACSQIASKVVVRGRTTAGLIGFTDFCSTNGSFESAAPGDFVACGPNVPRVQAGAILQESKAINRLVDSSIFNSTTWAKTGVGSVAPTVTANYCLAPDGTMRGDLITFEAASAAQLSEIQQSTDTGTGSCPLLDGGVNVSLQIYAWGVTLDGGTTSGTTDLCSYNDTVYGCTQVSWTGAGYTRLKRQNVVRSTKGQFLFGNSGLVSGVSHPQQSVCIAFAGCEEGATVSSPIDAPASLTTGELNTRMGDQVEAISLTRTAWIGDSLSAKTVASNSSNIINPRGPERYATLTSRVVDNWAVSGARFTTNNGTLISCVNQYSTWASRSGPQQVVLWCGINDIVGLSAVGATLWATEKAWIDALPAGTKRILLNLAPFHLSGAQETERVAFNTAMAADCVLNPTWVCVDIDLVLRDPGNHAELLSTYAAPDLGHLSQAGATAVGDAVAAAAP